MRMATPREDLRRRIAGRGVVPRLIWAADSGSVAAAEFLISAGVDVNISGHGIPGMPTVRQ